METTPSAFPAAPREVSTDTLIRRAHAVLEQTGQIKSPSWVNRAVRRYIRDFQAGTLAESDPYFMPHSESTGETAIRNVMASTKKGPSTAVSPAIAPGPAIPTDNPSEGTES